MFSFSSCRIWDKRGKTPRRDRVAIKADLETMPESVWEAMTYTREKVSKENRETVVRFWLNTETHISYYVDIHFDPGLDAWSFFVHDQVSDSVAEIICEKWPFLQILEDEDVEVETL